MDLEIAPLAMQAWLRIWGGVGRTREELIKKLGKPDYEDENTLSYDFTTIGGSTFSFEVLRGKIVSWKQEDFL